MPVWSHFGETDIIQKTAREFSVVSGDKTQLLQMKRSVLQKIKLEYPKIYENFEEIAHLKRQRNLQTMEKMSTILHKLELEDPRVKAELKNLVMKDSRVENKSGNFKKLNIRNLEKLRPEPVEILRNSYNNKSSTQKKLQKGNRTVPGHIEIHESFPTPSPV